MKIIQRNHKDYVLCEWRKRYVRLTPEEYVRQLFLHRLVEEHAYPSGLIAVEVPLENKRADAIIYDKNLHPLMLIEFKQQNVPLTQKTLDQAAVYNRQVGVPYLLLHNGRQSVVAKVDDKQIGFLTHIPDYGELI